VTDCTSRRACANDISLTCASLPQMNVSHDSQENDSSRDMTSLEAENEHVDNTERKPRLQRLESFLIPSLPRPFGHPFGIFLCICCIGGVSYGIANGFLKSVAARKSPVLTTSYTTITSFPNFTLVACPNNKMLQSLRAAIAAPSHISLQVKDALLLSNPQNPYVAQNLTSHDYH
jgi:hypothetical protein